jgi:ubiquinone/menaquinone biosynthesis C-methylase UbiE
MRSEQSMEDVRDSYTDFHKRHKPQHVYPSEWVIRTLLGRYPHLSLDRDQYEGSSILDMGFGDGRNWPLLHNLAFEIYGVEITEDIVALGGERARSLEIPVTLKVGTNSSIPFPDDSFDYVLASSSCYYVDAGTNFTENLREYQRVLKPGGILLATLPATGSSIFKGCLELGDGHVRICDDPWGLRNGYIFKWFQSPQDIEETFRRYFDSFSIGLCCDDYYGVQINLFLLVCRKITVA